MSIVTDPPATFADARSWSRRSHLVFGGLARDPLRRRMLAAGDTATVAAIGLALVVTSREAATWSLLFAPVWLVLAKLHGLYDRDHRALRHLTVDELPSIFVWATTGTMLLALFLRAATGGGVSISSAVVPGRRLASLPPPQETSATAAVAPRAKASRSALRRAMIRV